MDQTALTSATWLGMTIPASESPASAPPKFDSASLDATVTFEVPDESSSQGRTAPSPRVELVSGARPQLDHETEALLRVRLQAAATVLLIAVVAFFLRGFLFEDAHVRGLQAVVSVVLAVFVAVLWSPREISLAHLRSCELGIFGLIAIYLGIYEHQLVLAKANPAGAIYEMAAIKSCVFYFFAVIMLYGTFIPNTWQRAARVIIPLTVMPFLVMGLLRLTSAAVSNIANELANFEQISDNVIMMVLGAVAALYGTHIINSLRVAAFEARQMGQYRLKARLGAGGMGEVYLAEHCLLKRPCALKLIRPGQQTDPQAILRFEREVRATAKLTHWNTVNIFDYGRTEDGTFYYVMEYLPGMSLADLVSQHGPLPAARAIHLLRQMCRALHEAHAAGLVHRDIKPANIFAARLGGVCDVAKLLDFGLVQPAASDPSSQLLNNRTFSGSPLYMSPEQADPSVDADVRSDIYSLGATAYFLLTGKAPFHGKNLLEMIKAHAQEPVVPLSRHIAEIPNDLELVVIRCLAKRPVERFADALDLEQALAACRDAGGWTDADAASWWREHIP